MFQRFAPMRVVAVSVALVLATAGTSFAALSQTKRGDDFASASPKNCSIVVHPAYRTATLSCAKGQFGSVTYLLAGVLRYHSKVQTEGSTPTVTSTSTSQGLAVRVSLGGAAGRVTVVQVVGYAPYGG